MRLERIEFGSSEARKGPAAAVQTMNANIDVTEARLEKGILETLFSYAVVYTPDNSYIRLDGRAVFSGPESKEFFDEWKRTKHLGGPGGEFVVNAINYYASINAVFIARVFNLTPPIAPPTIKFETTVSGGMPKSMPAPKRMPAPARKK